MHQFGTKVLLGISMGYALNPGEVGLAICLQWIRRICQHFHHLKFMQKRFKSKEMDIQKRDNGFVFPCRTCEILRNGQPLSIAVYKAEGDLMRECQQKFFRRKRRNARDPDPDVKAQQDF